jgi:hypothetical protein
MRSIARSPTSGPCVVGRGPLRIARMSSSAKRRCPPGVRKLRSCPESAQRRRVDSSTPSRRQAAPRLSQRPSARRSPAREEECARRGVLLSALQSSQMPACSEILRAWAQAVNAGARSPPGGGMRCASETRASRGWPQALEWGQEFAGLGTRRAGPWPRSWSAQSATTSRA